MKTFEELDYAQTALGELILRRRRTTRGEEVFEVKLDGAFLMSSLVNTSEIALADLSLSEKMTSASSTSEGALPFRSPISHNNRAFAFGLFGWLCCTSSVSRPPSPC